jgi:hypothetical protein
VKLRLSVHRKAGAPGYGSDGASAEIELDIDDDATATQIATTIAPAWYLCLDRAVGDELTKLQAAHPQQPDRPQSLAEGRPLPAQQQPARQPAREPEPAPRRWNPDDVPERPAQRRPEPGWDDDAQPPERPAQNGTAARNGQRQGGGTGQGQRDDPPRTGKQLLGWAYGHGQDDRLKALAKSWDLGRITEWSDDNVTAAYRELSRQSTAAGSWGGN